MPKKILVVDDDPDIRKLVTRRLQTQHYDVIIATDGREALAKAQHEQPDLIILDLMLPQLNGHEVCTMLKQDARYRHIPIVMLTAKAPDEHEEIALEYGADVYLTKPYTAEVLLRGVAGLLAKSSPT
jgi:DNA-binding response OmpR family regulator